MSVYPWLSALISLIECIKHSSSPAHSFCIRIHISIGRIPFCPPKLLDRLPAMAVRTPHVALLYLCLQACKTAVDLHEQRHRKGLIPSV
jgi:hypothetical protein